MPKSDFDKFEKKIGIEFKDKNLLAQAFTHRSFLNENPSKNFKQNERLEFLGDAVLELAVTEYLYKTYPEKNEGEMTALRSALVNANMLSDIAAGLAMGELMLLSKGEAKGLMGSSDDGHAPTKAGQYILANAIEALIGAIYIDGGYENACLFIGKNILPKISEIISKKLWIDAKSLFQEKAQEFEGVTPSYKIINESGPDHDKIFTVGVFLGDKMISDGKGASKQTAEQEAAGKALEEKNWDKK